MAYSPDHPLLTFVQAKYYGTGRSRNVSPLWIVIHDMEAGEYSGRAESTAAYFANPGDDRTVSSHYTVDNDSVIQCVLLKDTAWTVGNAPGNNRGINWELAGFARQTREEWLDPFGLAMFAQMAPYVRSDAARYGIPLERRTVSELLSGKPGITSHNDLRVAFGGTTHTDPGPNFPWDVFMDMMRGGVMAEYTEAQMRAFAWQYNGRGLTGNDETPEGNKSTLQVFNDIWQTNLAMQAEQARQGLVLAEILAKVSAGGGEGNGTVAEHSHIPGGVNPS